VVLYGQVKFTEGGMIFSGRVRHWIIQFAFCDIWAHEPKSLRKV